MRPGHGGDKKPGHDDEAKLKESGQNPSPHYPSVHISALTFGDVQTSSVSCNGPGGHVRIFRDRRDTG
jgi:hypothetical protein